MQENSTGTKPRHTGFIRLGGLAIVFGLGIHVIANGVLKQFPPEDPSLVELRAYLTEEASTWAVVHGLRHVAFVCIVLFAAALFLRTCRTNTSSATGWGVVGLIGATLHVAIGIIANGIETLAFMDFSRLSEQRELFWLLFYLTRVLFTAEIVAWALVIIGFSVAGWASSTIPKWLVALGLLSGTAGILSGVFIVSILTDGWAVPLVDIAALTGLAWFACTGVYLALRGAS